jgi:vacuolar-type H+-ATPase subunit I/STV1
MSVRSSAALFLSFASSVAGLGVESGDVIGDTDSYLRLNAVSFAGVFGRVAFETMQGL